MIDALRYEWLRIRTIRSTYWITAIAVLIGVGLSFLIAMGSSIAYRQTPPSPQELDFLAPAIVTQFAAVAGPYLIAYVLVIVGVLSWGHEYRHGMIRITLTALRSRTQVWIAKFVVIGLWTVATVAAILLFATLVGWLWLHDDGVRFSGSPLLRQYGRALLYMLIFVWIGTAAAAIIRNQTAALVVVFLWPLALEPILGLIIRLIPGMDGLEKVSKAFPFNAGDRLIHSTEVGEALDAFLGGAQISTVAGTLIFAGFAALVMAVSYLLFLRRDA
ncbi:MAG: ABC transporter permease [Nocardioidaceae bacterium]